MAQRQNFKSIKSPLQPPRRSNTENRHRPPAPGSRSSTAATLNDDRGCNPEERDMRRSKAYHHLNSQQQQNQGGFPFTKVYTPSKTHGACQKSPSNYFPTSSSTSHFTERKSEYHGRRGGGSSNHSRGTPPAAYNNQSTRQIRHGGVLGYLREGAAKEVDANNDEDKESIRINSTVLSRIDKDFLKLHGTASQVAVYRFNPTAKSWDTTDTVGCLFLYERKIGPRYGLVVMNRKNTNNFIQCFGSDGQVVLQAPYLLLRSGEEDHMTGLDDGTQAIYCIWFYDNQDCLTSANILRKMKLKFEGETDASERAGVEGRSSMNSGQLTGTALLHILHQNKKENISPRTKLIPAKVITAEELESEMLSDTSPSPMDQMRTLEQVEGEMKELSANNNFLNTTMDLQNELIKALGIRVNQIAN